MNKKTLMLAGIGIVVLIAAVTGFLVTRQDNTTQNDSAATTTTTKETENTSQQRNDGKTFNPLVTETTSYQATISGADEDGSPYTGVFKNNGAGIAQFSTEIDGESADFYYADNSYIFCQGTDCFRISAEAGEVPFDLDTFEFSSSDISTYKESATFVESAACPAGTCDVWSYTDAVATGKIYISSDNHISQLVTSDENGNEVKIIYEYKPIDLVLPENIQELPSAP